LFFSQGIKPPAAATGSNRAAGLTDAQARELKKTSEDVATLRKEMSELRSMLEKKSPELQGGVPSFRKQTGN